jgi:hypothetical protein
MKLLFAAFLFAAWPVAPNIDPQDPNYDTLYDEWHAGEVDTRSQDAGLHSRYPITLSLNQDLVENIGRKVLYNETHCQASALVHWNTGELFPSLGIGHAIWFPRNVNPGFQESFPNLMKFIRLRISAQGKMMIPAWLDMDVIGPAPWADKNEFDNPPIGLAGKKEELQAFLSLPEVVRLQMAYLVYRLETGIYKILADTEWKGDMTGAQKIYDNFLALSSGAFGLRSMVDYTNFKGEGVRWIERTYFNKYQWGLKQVLLQMPDQPTNLYMDFADAAQMMLERVVANVAPERQELAKKWLVGWTVRVNETYRDGNLDRPPCQFLDDLLNPKP